MPPRPRLTADDWAVAALDACTAGGLAGLSVEKIAAQLGATKGSFYWHYKDRDALVVAALALWERRQTEAVIAELADVPDPRERLRRLTVLTAGPPGQIDPVVSLFRDVADARVRLALDRVTRRRIDYIRDQLVEIGLPEEAAARRATLSYASYLGWWQLVVTTPDLVTSDAARQGYVDTLLGMLALQEPAS